MYQTHSINFLELFFIMDFGVSVLLTTCPSIVSIGQTL